MIEKIITGSDDNEPKVCECDKDTAKMTENVECLEVLRQMASDLHTICMMMTKSKTEPIEAPAEETEDVITFNQRR